MTKRKVCFLISSIVTSLIISGCGGSDDNNGIGTSLNSSDDVITFNLFDSKYNPNSNVDAIQRIQHIYKDGSRELNRIDIIDTNTRGGLNNEDLVVLGNNFESVLAQSNIKVKGNSITFPMTGIMSGRTETYTIELQPIDIKGVSRRDVNSSNNTGLYTVLDEYNKIPRNERFPDGSLCYVLKKSSTIPFYTLDIKNDSSNFLSLTDWVSDKTLYDTPIRTEESLVGATNQYPVVRLVYDTDPNKEYKNSNAVNYENTIYEAEYVDEGSLSENIDPTIGIVNCTIINDVAADFLEAQITKYYN